MDLNGDGVIDLPEFLGAQISARRGTRSVAACADGSARRVCY
jgi:hypothetical protein